MNRKKKRIDGEKIFSIVASLAIVAALVAGIVSVIKNSTKETKKKNYIDLNVVEIETTTEEPTTYKEPETTAKKIEKETTAESKQVDVTVPEDETIAVNVPVYKFSETDTLGWPIKGNIVLGFNMDNTIYFPTLDVYRCNPAIMIAADAGTEVKSAAPGIVEEVYVDNETGTTVKIAIGDGYELTYGQLTDITVGISDKVDAGTVIGKVSEPTKYFTKEGSNLYFKLTKDGVALDPMLYFENEDA